MSSTKHTPAEIAKALVKEISKEEGGQQSKKLWRAVHQNKAVILANGNAYRDLYEVTKGSRKGRRARACVVQSQA
ncbi:hypothetical protein WN944_014419 [Citrus x changshan-huyou]|uniref:Uncharacterized protein n=1 Tax=Citrus x changshan-huyou TaxID=2935761 RepID=A0AAP0M5M9_9ROSI